MAPKVTMDRHVHERLLRLKSSSAMPFIDGTFVSITFLEIICIISVDEVKKLNGGYEVAEMVRVIVVAYTFRFMQSRFGHNKVPLVYYLRKVLLFHDIPITALISAFYTIIRIFPKLSDGKLAYMSVLLPAFILVYFPKGMELLEQYIGLTDASLNTELVNQQGYDAANSLISSTSNFSQYETEASEGVHVTDHFVIIHLAGLCVDLMLQHERLAGSDNLVGFCIVLATMRASRFLQLRQLRLIAGKNNVPTVYYQQNTLLFYYIPITAVIAGVYAIFRIFSKSLFLVFILESSTLYYNFCREIQNKVKGVELLEKDAANANSISDTNNSSRWIHKDRIGSGGFGAVFVAENRETRAIAAVKVLKDNHRPENVESIQKEIEFLRQLEHPNIVKYIDHEIVGRDIYLYMEFIQPGSLDKYISKEVVLHEYLIRHFTAQILSGLFYLHSKKIVHRDIKPDNILVGYNKTVKLVDFGLAKHLAKSVGKHSVLGTPYYAAPELYKDMIYKNSGEGSTADIWSLGCVIIEMFTGKIPLHDSKMKHPTIPEELCLDGKDFLEHCFKENPTERASAKELLSHPFVKGTN